MIRTNHYERAFEAYLRTLRVPYLAISEKHRNAVAQGLSIKTPDFLLSPLAESPWIVDVKGRRFSGTDGYWKHWATWDDLIGMRRWESLFGRGFRGLFVFAYEIRGPWSPLPPEKLFTYRGRLYGFVALESERYIPEVRLLSPRWNTYSMPTERFRRLARPFEDFV